MKKTFKVICALLSFVFVCSALVGCGGEKTVLNIYNVGDYIDTDVIKMFEKENPNIKINYETFYTNEEMYIKVANKSTAYDVIVPSDYMVERLISEDLLYEIDYNNVPNMKNIGEQYLNKDYDPDNKYSVPYMWGTMGVLYNKTMVDEPVTSWKILWNEKYKDKIFMYNSERDTIAITLRMLGYSMNSKDDAELNAARDALIAQKDLVLAYCGDEVKDKMIANEGAMTIAWSGDAFYCIDENPDLAYAIPEEGSNLWFDSLVIPKTSQHKAEAEKFIDFMCRPEIAKMNAEYIGYSTANEAGRELLDDEIKNDPLRYPDLSTLKNMEVFRYDKELSRKNADIWQQIKISE